MTEDKNNSSWLLWGGGIVVVSLMFFAYGGSAWIMNFIIVAILYVGYILIKTTKK